MFGLSWERFRNIKILGQLVLGPKATLDANGVVLTVSELQELNNAIALTTGETYYVDSNNGSSGYPGTTKELPKATIDQGINLCSAGDTVVVLPGHAENVTTNDQIDVDVVGVTVIGIGNGARRPTLTWSGTDATACVAMAAASTRLLNIVLVSSDAGDDITGMVRIEADDIEVGYCEFREGTGQPECAILVSDAVDRSNVHHCRGFFPTNGAAANDSFITYSGASTAANGHRFEDNDVQGTFDQACVWCSDATNALTGWVIRGNRLINTATSLYAIDLTSGTNMTGLITGNVVETDAEATSLRGGGCTLVGNQWGLDTKQSAHPGMPFGNSHLSVAGAVQITSTTADEIAVVSAGGPIVIEHIFGFCTTLHEAEAAAVVDNIVTGSSGNLYSADQETALQDSAYEVGDYVHFAQGGPAVLEQGTDQLEDARPLNWLIQASDTIDIEGGSAAAEGDSTIIIQYRSLGGELEVESP